MSTVEKPDYWQKDLVQGRDLRELTTLNPVSYTHLTLPTSDLV